MSVIHAAQSGGEAVEMVTVTISSSRITVYDYKGIAHTESFETLKGTILVASSTYADAVQIEGDYQSVFYVPGSGIANINNSHNHGAYDCICVQGNLTLIRL